MVVKGYTNVLYNVISGRPKRTLGHIFKCITFLGIVMLVMVVLFEGLISKQKRTTADNGVSHIGLSFNSYPRGFSLRKGQLRQDPRSISMGGDQKLHHTFKKGTKQNLPQSFRNIKHKRTILPGASANVKQDLQAQSIRVALEKETLVKELDIGIKWQRVRNRTRKGKMTVHGVSPQLLGDFRKQEGPEQTLRRFRRMEKRIPYPNPVSRAIPRTEGEPWPYPHFYKRINYTARYILHVSKTSFVIPEVTCDIIEKAVKRHKAQLMDLQQEAQGSVPAAEKRTDPGWAVLKNVQISISHRCAKYPSLQSDESYELYIKDAVLHLRAHEVWGALHGLKTLSQLVLKSKGLLVLKEMHIKDAPRFKHRGVMLDTSRHFLSKQVLLQNLDAMEMNKMNVFHWHIVDDQSFPYQSQIFPELSMKGAYTERLVYTPDDIKEIVEYARLRGIRVIPELDTPGHVESWKGLADILTPCGLQGHYGPIDPTQNATYQKLTELFSEVLSLFQEGTLHFGGDECSYYCWSMRREILEYMKENKMESDYRALFSHYFSRLYKEMTEKLKGKLFNSIYWQEVFDEGVILDKNSIIQVWKDEYNYKLAEVTRAGHRAVLSSCWYLNYIKYGKDWHELYMCDPQVFTAASPGQKELVIGGEACMWGEYVDDNNLLNDLWPRASAVAERLWSSQTLANPHIAEGRFEEHRCRMVRRGIPAKAIGGPGPPCMDKGTT